MDRFTRPTLAWLANRRPISAWKLVDTAHAKAVAAGSVRLGTSVSYANLEDGRADPLDGAVDVVAKSLISGIPEHDAAMKRLGYRAGVIAGDRFVFSAPSVFVFCMSAIGCTHVPAPPKPRTMFEISDVARLANLLVAKNREQLSGEWCLDWVRYQRVHYNALEEFPKPNPFVKDVEFSAEQELRLLFIATGGRAKEAFNTLSDDEIASLLSRRIYTWDSWF